MGDGAVWIAAFTGATAVLASWVTNLGNVRAARAQAEASAEAQLRGRVRELRRAAYLEFMEQAHVVGELYWQTAFDLDQLVDPERRATRVQDLRTELRGAFDPLMRSVRVVVLEGPVGPAESAEAVLRVVADTNRVLWRISRGEPEARAAFDEGHQEFARVLERFVETARAAMKAP
ncbi:hypothetical protein [Streptomyces sp. NPDC046909]|uniref:hypothetical protein n=1 Tax=Streptomyces sp. NPDC046909 TaxID=3155617 RepID=UPI0033C145F9